MAMDGAADGALIAWPAAAPARAGEAPALPRKIDKKRSFFLI